MLAELVSQSVARIAAELPRVTVVSVPAKGGHVVHLPFAATAEYRIKLWFYEDGERQIEALRIDASGLDLQPQPSFWCHPFELDDYDRSLEALAQAFDERVVSLLHVPTRVRVRRGWLWSHTVMEREGSLGNWVAGHGVGYLGPSGLERTPSREHTYSAPRLDQAEVAAPGV